MTTRRVRESAPVQVYLTAEEQERLSQLAGQLGESKSAVLRRGLLALERETMDPDNHPALRLIGLVAEERQPKDSIDPARAHDQLLADAEEASWAVPATRKARNRER
jgi:hypothetical protein